MTKDRNRRRDGRSSTSSALLIGPVERLDLADRGVPPWVREQHVQRYQWACGFASGLRVLDIACGSGYGTAMLANAGAAEIVGADIDADAVSAANRTFGTHRLRYDVQDATRVGFADFSFDVIVSFETIEHIRDDEAYLREMRRVLRPNGVFLCSTPNRTIMNPGRSIDEGSFNPHHVREYDEHEFRRALGSHFSKVELLGQSPYPTAYMHALRRLARLHRILAVRAHQSCKLASAIFERRGSGHSVVALSPGRVSEFFVAQCRA